MNTSAPNPSGENTVWAGTPSQLRNLGLYGVCVVVAIALIASGFFLTGIARTIALVMLLLPFGAALWRWLTTATTQYTLTDQRLILRSGVFARRTDYVELYRVKDLDYTQSFLERLLGLGTIRLRSSQDSVPVIVLDGMRGGEALWNRMRDLVEARRTAKGVREMDMNTESNG